MTTRESVQSFLEQPAIAIVGASRSGGKFGNTAMKELKSKGYRLFPVHPEAESIEGVDCTPDIRSLPEEVRALLVVVPPEQTEKIIPQAIEAGIEHIWMQQGAESQAAIAECIAHKVNVVHGECILMFAEPTALPHRMHRWVWGLLGKLPD